MLLEQCGELLVLVALLLELSHALLLLGHGSVELGFKACSSRSWDVAAVTKITNAESLERGPLFFRGALLRDPSATPG